MNDSQLVSTIVEQLLDDYSATYTANDSKPLQIRLTRDALLQHLFSDIEQIKAIVIVNHIPISVDTQAVLNDWIAFFRTECPSTCEEEPL